MNITSIVYGFHDNKVFVKAPFEIVRETEKCFFTKDGCRYLKNEMDRPFLKSATQYPYIELVMVDADEETLRDGLSKWFTDKACQVWKIKECL